MEPMKSHESAEQFAISLLFKVLDDASYSVKRTSLERDKELILHRVSCEGLSFLTKSLPRFLKAVISGLERGTYIPPMGFSLIKGSLLPKFLSGWTTRVFDITGCLVARPDEFVISELIQICSLLYKLELPHSEVENQQVISRFIKNEQEIKDFVLPDDDFSCNVIRVAKQLIHCVLGGLNFQDIKPRHGPGAVATGEKGNQKFSFGRKFQRLHQMYPYYEYFSPSLMGRHHGFSWYKNLTTELNPVAKVVLVPKDSRGPRLISMEPLETQWIQQGLMRLVTARVEKHPLTRGKVSFEDQTSNQVAALEGSISRSIATMDLKDASDRISLRLFRAIFPKDCVDSFEACRSVATILPDGKMQTLSKFAPMGSALCFPVLALTIWALVEATLRLERQSTDDIRVFGDDLVIPNRHFSLVCKVLTSFGLLVNVDKSFTLGSFRESCGMDAFNGVQVTPIRVKKLLQSNARPDPSTLAHLIELSDAFFKKGYWSACQYLRDEIQAASKGSIPWTHSKNHLGFYCPERRVCISRNMETHKHRFNSDLQRVEVLAPVARSVNEDSQVDIHARRLKGLIGLYAFGSESHVVSLRGRSNIRMRWCAA